MEDRQVVRTFNLDPLSDDVEYNILLIGTDSESKTTFIKSFSNYANSNSCEAMDDELKKAMPSTFDQIQSVHTFRRNCKLIRLINCPAKDPANDYIWTIQKCAVNYPKLHAIVLVVNVHGNLFDDFVFEKNVLLLLPTIHKSACNNVVLCFTSNRVCEFSNETFEQLQSHIRRYTKIQAPKHGQNLLTIGKFAFKHFDEPTNQNKMNRIDSSEQIQTMLDWLASCEPFELKNVVELTQAYHILYFCVGIAIAYYDDESFAFYEAECNQAKLLKQNPTEYARVEEIFLKLWALVMPLTMIHPFVFVDKIIKRGEDDYFKNFKECFEKLRNVCENCQSEVKLRQCSETEYFHELFNELYKLPHVGSYFVNLVTTLCPDELRQVLSILMKNNLLLVECAGLAKRDMSNVTFTCDGDLTSRVVDLVLHNLTEFPNINHSDIQFVLEHIDSLIKYNFIVICDNLPMEEDTISVNNTIQGQQDHDDCCCVIL